MRINLYNTSTKKIEEFVPILKNEVGVYSCGPTVYWNQHLGHMYAYIQWDCLVRMLRFFGYKVKWVMNITDVGHMTSDQDEGEDKMEKGAKREGLSPWEVAEKYLKQFKESMAALNIGPPDVLCRATDHIQDQIELIKKIEARGFTYKTKTGLVFDTSKFPGYADFAQLNLEEQCPGSRVEVDPEKKKPWDFLLWVTNQPKHIMQWDSPWGRGFPGWHIECTAMSVKYLGERFDIHTGGKEHIPVHHTNEIAQAYGAFGHPTANFWLHNEWLTFKGEKLSKSSGNMILVSDLVKKGFNPLAFRYLVVTSHYRSGLEFSWESLRAAAVALEKLYDYYYKFSEFEREEVEEGDWDFEFKKALADDLNLPKAIAVVWEMVKSDLKEGEKRFFLEEWDRVLGLNFEKSKEEERLKITDEIKSLVEKREKLRKEKRWKEADLIREELGRLGFEIEDTPQGPKIKRKMII